MREGDAFSHGGLQGHIDAVIGNVAIVKDDRWNGYEVVFDGGRVVSVKAYPMTPERTSPIGDKQTRGVATA